MIGMQLRAMRPPGRNVSISCKTVADEEHTLVDRAAGDRVLVAAAQVSVIVATPRTRNLLPRYAADDGDARAALADRDVEPGEVDPLAALRRARRRAAGAAAGGRGGRESGEAGEGEGEDLGEHGGLWGAEAGAGKCRMLSWRANAELKLPLYLAGKMRSGDPPAAVPDAMPRR
jgi:hypothetical protein